MTLWKEPILFLMKNIFLHLEILFNLKDYLIIQFLHPNNKDSDNKNTILFLDC